LAAAESVAAGCAEEAFGCVIAFGALGDPVFGTVPEAAVAAPVFTEFASCGGLVVCAGLARVVLAVPVAGALTAP